MHPMSMMEWRKSRYQYNSDRLNISLQLLAYKVTVNENLERKKRKRVKKPYNFLKFSKADRPHLKIMTPDAPPFMEYFASLKSALYDNFLILESDL